VKRISKLGVSALALAALMTVTANIASATDVADPGCTLHGAMMLGGMYGNQSYDASSGGPDLDDTNWTALFGEGAGLVTCDAWNFQSDFAYYDHSTEVDVSGKDVDVGGSNGHLGGAVFWRDPSFALGVSGSWVNEDTFFKDINYARIGAFGEFYVGDQFTLGGSAHYFTNTEDIFGAKDHDGFELAAIAKFYPTTDLALTLRGDMMLSEMKGGGEKLDFDGLSITGEAEYLVWDEGLSLFAGGRYANREFSEGGDSIDINDLQAYIGIKFAFGSSGGSLVDRDRSGAYDNTSVMLEKLPNWVDSFIAAEASAVP
jgi:hypothetical protein